MFWSACPYFVLTMFKFCGQNKKNQGDQGGKIQLTYILKKSQPTNVNGKGKKPRVATKKEDFFFI